jgi:6-phosphogluconolactonase/glucosamine-6-phosphate isomerase/deaminase
MMVKEKRLPKDLKIEIENKTTYIQEQINNLSDSTYDWLQQSSNLLKLVNQAKELFKAANGEQKQQMLNFVASNCILKDKKVSFMYNKPFEIAFKIKSAEKKKDQNKSDRLSWLGSWDSNPGPIG